MRIDIPKFEDKKSLFNYLSENKKDLIAKKKSMPIYSDVIGLDVSKIGKTGLSEKANNPIMENVDTLRVKVVANTANWMDSHSDVLLRNSWQKSIQERKNFIPHLHDHIHEISAKVGEVVDIFGQDLSYSELGIAGIGTTQALIFITDIMKSYNEKVFNQYKMGRVNQHSIGLQYVKIQLAINDADFKDEHEVWNKYNDDIINKSHAEKQGFFWAVQEIKLIENSAVLFGSNEITPTLDNNLKTEPSADTQKTEAVDETTPEQLKPKRRRTH
jgi:hypothetical protein